MRGFAAFRAPAVFPALVALAALAVSGLTLSAGQAARAADAVDVYGEIQNPALQARFEHITKDLRCLVCQNESIADSNVELAADLRRQVREMLIAGKSDDAIFQFMTDRYGEFVRFNPPLTPKTWLIWGAPFIMVAVGVIIIVRVARQRSRQPLDDEPASEIE
jgi:cytochrome c-type biogenesis protein CcmH